MVDSACFKAFVLELDPRYVLPKWHSLSQKLVPESYDKTCTMVKTNLAAATEPSITTDMWTSSNNILFMGVTAHWPTQNFTVENKSLAIRPAPGSHMADFTATELTAVYNEWVVKCNVHVVADSGANVQKGTDVCPEMETMFRPQFVVLCDWEFGTITSCLSVNDLMCVPLGCLSHPSNPSSLQSPLHTWSNKPRRK